MKKTAGIITVIGALFMLNGCGGDSGMGNTDYETALYLAYSTTNIYDPMYEIAYGDIYLFIKDMTDRTTQYILHCGTTCQNTINLSTPPSGFVTPSGVTGVISSNLDPTALTVNADLTLNGYKDTLSGKKSYSGTVRFKGNGITSSYEILKNEVTIPNLKISYTDKNYKEADYNTYSVAIDNSTTGFPKYTLTGNVSVDSRGYSYNGFSFYNSSSLVVTVSGDVTEDGFTFNVAGSPQADAQSKWRTGSLTLSYKEDNSDTITETCTVTLDQTTANFQITDGDQWDWLNWLDSARCP